jgi:hypothetical protein
LPRKRARTDLRFFQAQLIGFVNFPWVPQAHDMPAVDLAKAVVLEELPKA